MSECWNSGTVLIFCVQDTNQQHRKRGSFPSQFLIDIAERMGPLRATSLSENFSYQENEGQKEDLQNWLREDLFTHYSLPCTLYIHDKI